MKSLALSRQANGRWRLVFALFGLLALAPTSLPAQNRDIGEELRSAVQSGDLERAKRAISRGASVNYRDVGGMTVLMHAAQRGDLPIVQFLVEKGAVVDAYDNDKATALMHGLVRGSEDVALFLLDHAVEIDAINDYGWGALISAAGQGYVELTRRLLERGYEPDLRDPRTELMTPLMAATMRRHEVIVRLLYCYGASPEAVDAQARTALDLAIERGHRSIADFLRRPSCDPEVMDQLLMAVRQDSRVRSLVAAGRYAEAIPFAEQVLELYTTVVGDEHIDTGASLNRLAQAHLGSGDLRAAYPLLERALAVLERMGEGDGPDAAAVLSNLAVTAQHLGDYEAATAWYQRSLALKRHLLAPDDPELATTLDNFAGLLVERGRLSEARPLLEQALGIRALTPGTASLKYATSLNNLARLHEDQGDYEAAEQRLEHAVEILRDLGARHPTTAAALSNLGNLRVRQRDLEGGRDLMREALEISELALGPSHPQVALMMMNLAEISRQMGDWGEAHRLLTRSLATNEAAFSPNHPMLAQQLNNLGVILRQRGEYAESGRLLERALAITEEVLGPSHPRAAETLNNLGFLYWRLAPQEPDAARSRFMRATEIVSEHLEGTLPSLSAAEQRGFIERYLPRQTWILLSISREDRTLEEAYEYLLRWKGFLTHALRREKMLTRLARDGQDPGLVSELQSVRAELAERYHETGQSSETAWRADSWRRGVEELTQRKEALERQLAAVAGGGGEALTSRVELAGLRQRLPAGTAFVDIYRYQHFAPPATAVDRYAAILVTREDPLRLLDLGAATRIDTTVRAWRLGVLEGRRGDLWEGLRSLVWRPVAEALPSEVARVWLSPDGLLARVPWNVLAESDSDGGGTFVSQVDSGRQLVALLEGPLPRRGGKGPVLLVGDINFGSGRSLGEISGRYSPLPGTAREIAAILVLARANGIPATQLTGGEATKDSVTASMPKAAVAHLATHGFFSRGPGGRSGSRGLEQRNLGLVDVDLGQEVDEEQDRGRAVRNPMVESGIALAGANVTDTFISGSQGLLTAEELLGLALPETDLVVLSACDTGRGEEVTGQGVLGLRSSVMAAGARSMLMSLWKVPDQSTALLMTEFYRNLWENGVSKAEALRAAQATVRNHPSGEYRAPVHWAAWVLAGEAW